MTRLGWVGLWFLWACAAPQPETAPPESPPAESTPVDPVAEETDSDSDSDADSDADADADADADSDADADADSDADSENRSPSPASETDPADEDDSDADYPADLDEDDSDSDEEADYSEVETTPEPPPRRAVCSVPDPPRDAGADCPGVRRHWVNVPSQHMRCGSDSDCVAVPAGHCRHVGLNQRAARRGRYRRPICAGRGEGACGGGQPQVRCNAGCCEALPAGLGGFF